MNLRPALGGVTLLVLGGGWLCGADLPYGWQHSITLSTISGGGVTTNPLSSGGGRFRATIGGVSAAIWCVDAQLQFTPGQTVRGNVLNFSDIDPSNPLAGAPASYTALGATQDVRYETVTTATGIGSWQQNIAGMAAAIGAAGGNASVVSNYGNLALFRYKAAAWLITQYNTPGLETNANNTHNLVIQRSIWDMLDIQPDEAYSTTEGSVNWFNEAVKFVSNNWNSSMWNEWRVVSAWVPNASGGPGVRNIGSNVQRQTFLTQLTPTPEPGSFALLGLGMAGLIAVARFRRSRSLGRR